MTLKEYKEYINSTYNKDGLYGVVSIRWTVYCPSHKKSVPLPQIFDSLSICDNVQQETEREASIRRGEALRRRSSS